MWYKLHKDKSNADDAKAEKKEKIRMKKKNKKKNEVYLICSFNSQVSNLLNKDLTSTDTTSEPLLNKYITCSSRKFKKSKYRLQNSKNDSDSISSRSEKSLSCFSYKSISSELISYNICKEGRYKSIHYSAPLSENELPTRTDCSNTMFSDDSTVEYEPIQSKFLKNYYDQVQSVEHKMKYADEIILKKLGDNFAYESVRDITRALETLSLIEKK
ncbi:hypothetical protein Kpol_1051p27 [Vanderwaltozyma polyspora DSM 70294]|uniref:Uncharacterized protein n=1 Tax=Vanderwaltozyma polyspora (strain ATCC 22028 / DSM 70294 / BCRC 21397 / CBS 2163 / NBRC 10782 / NRRL Y-8283 / UCD 57-17) TaxID=436907 RepID=A7TMZ0_VANPO|nr:uncharacterized protein Kpol_1051p27 [Vanderwaltozyma polyspora DSM 70294]EDO16378.1 hypothetical protein Kpol_1051p27 [Vanderwaltozyma polyspora DSM 70294]